MNGQKGGMIGWMEGWDDRWMDKIWLGYGWIDWRMGGWDMNGQMGRWVDGWIDGWMRGWMMEAIIIVTYNI